MWQDLDLTFQKKAVFYNGINASVNKGRAMMSPIWASVRPWTQSLLTSFSPDLKDIDFMSRLMDEELVARLYVECGVVNGSVSG